MAETQLTDAEVLAIQALQAEGQDAAGAGPGGYQYSKQHETWLYKMTRQEHKLLTMAAAANVGRVFKDGDLTFGVEAIQWYNGSTLITKAEASAQGLTDNETNYIYYDQAGGLQVNITAFPDPATTPHIPLATILTASATYAYDDITDKRQAGFISIPGGTYNPVCYENEIVCYENQIVTA